ncbi:GTP cyclohydrolase II [Aspergillus heteromorphus CBS 117.55]|uniref:GTP cyclohydrolase II n=1 Tax=Aspergillus heteromorphus CBS 117.55 TaxID=1448321 RepID=A0A317VV83_9EURO|nr:GTP cyclohydrolase II [Aspergillus heteromorphus CBS 117.55]PWY77519.1 GTP cyclohydrolase II [Aspergillus heteromorphus CBS 117.55]
MSSNLPSHASPSFTAQASSSHPVDEISLGADQTAPLPLNTRVDDLRGDAATQSDSVDSDRGDVTPAVPASLLSPSFTPPATPGGTFNTANLLQQTQESTHTKPPKLLACLPNVECIVRARIPTTNGAEMFLHLYLNDLDNKEHLAIVFGNTIRSRSLDKVRPGETEMDRMIRGAYVGTLHPGRVSSWYDSANAEGTTGAQSSSGTTDDGPVSQQSTLTRSSPSQAPLVRIHSECYTGETAWSARCDCGEQLDEAARLMSFPMETLAEIASQQAVSVPSNASGGVIVYLRQEGRGIGLGEKLKAYNLQDLGSDTVEANLLLRHPADARSYGLATAMLVDLGLGEDSNPHGIRLLTNNPDKVRAIEGPGREVVVKERVPMIPIAWRSGGKKGINSSEIEGYLRTKIAKMGHMIE